MSTAGALKSGFISRAGGEHALDWNGPTDRPFRPWHESDLDRSILDHFERVALRNRHRVAITDGHTSLSYGQLWEALSGMAETIAANTARGELVGILLPPCVLAPVAMLACMAAGRPFVPLDPHYPADWLKQVLSRARPGLLLVNDRATDYRAGNTRVIQLVELPAPARKDWRRSNVSLDEPACVLFTSGSTGHPKGIVNSQRALLQRVLQSINAAHINDEDRFLTLASLCTVVGVRDTLTALLAGASLHLLDIRGLDPRQLSDVIEAERITILFSFPALLRSLVRYGAERAGSTLRLVRLGGDTILRADIELLQDWLAPGALIQSIYAATEAPIMQWFINARAVRGSELRVPIGYPLDGNRLAVIHESGRPARVGEVGELWVRSRYVALGLWTEESCVSGPFETDATTGERLFRTGDLVRVRPDGLFDRLGRKDRQVKIRGARVELEAVEAALRQHPHVGDAGALVRTDGPGGELTLIAYVSLRAQPNAPSSSPSTARLQAPAELLAELRARMASLPPPMRPARLYLTREIPRLPSSKLDVRALAAIDATNIQAERTHATVAADCIAQSVASVWMKVLSVPLRSLHEDFFAAGGDSLKAIRLTGELQRALGVDVPLTLINEAPTFHALCNALRAQQTTRYTPLVLLKAGEELPALFFVHGAGGNVAELFPIARSMTYPGPVFGFQARGLARRDPPHVSVEAMATEYLLEIKARQRQGPYHLCGYSFGGFVAFEMARQLREAGDEVGILGLFDTIPARLSSSMRFWAACVRQKLTQLAAKLIGAPGADRFCEQIRPPAVPGFLESAPASVLKVAASALLAAVKYRPGFYPGELKLFVPTERDPKLPCPQAAWRAHARSVSVIRLPGAHLTMLSMRHADSAAASLSQLLPRREPGLAAGAPDLATAHLT